MNICYFSQLWPKRAFSAAHERTFGIIERMILNNIKPYYITPQDKKKSENIKQYIDVKCFQADPSNTTRVNLVLGKIQSPTYSIFDTYVSESLYSHYVHQVFPSSIKVLDLQDLHSLRLKREELLPSLGDKLITKEILQAKPNLGEDITDKEMASIIRSDLILSCSDYEMELIQHLNKKVQLITFFYPTTRQLNEDDRRALELKKLHYKRRHFVFLGNMAHRPNLDSIKYLRDKIWPIIYAKLPQAQLHVYGSNFPAELRTNEEQGFICKGLMSDIIQLGKYRVMLAPIRYGGGVKGKITDAWRELLPVITTPMGAEGLFLESTQAQKYGCVNNIKSQYYSDFEPDRLNTEIRNQCISQELLMKEYYQYENSQEIGNKLHFGGSFNNWEKEQFAEEAIKIYSNESEWWEAAQMGEKILQTRMDTSVNEKLLMKAFSEIQLNIGQIRKQDILQKLTWSESLRSNYHFAKYLDEKRKNQELSGKIKQSN